VENEEIHMSGGGGYMRGGRKDLNRWERDINKGFKLTKERYEFEWNRRGESGEEEMWL
jgi:hypothetical protein